MKLDNVVKFALIGAGAVSTAVCVVSVVKMIKARKNYNEEFKELSKDLDEYNEMVNDYNKNLDSMSDTEADAKIAYFEKTLEELLNREKTMLSKFNSETSNVIDDIDIADDANRDVVTAVNVLSVVAMVVAAAGGPIGWGAFGILALNLLIKEPLMNLLGDYFCDKIIEKVIANKEACC